MNKYGPKAQETIENTMERFKKGKLNSCKTVKKVTDRYQADAIGINEAQNNHNKVPPEPKD
jgi:hypothetical protein